MGNQGLKRRQSIGADFVGFVDPFCDSASHSFICDVPLESYDAAMICTPDEEKYSIIEFLLGHEKHVLCEKPLVFGSYEQFLQIQSKATKSSSVYYTAYNHRFEPAITMAKDIVDERRLGDLYFINIFYGNGTSQDIKNSSWKDKHAGVVHDLGSHLINLVDFWFPQPKIVFQSLVSSFETKSPDYAILNSIDTFPLITLEMTTCMWKNTFRADIIGSRGSLHIEGLGKWGGSTLSERTRVYPSGVPREAVTTFESGDLTLKYEYQHFKKLIAKGLRSNFDSDFFIWNTLANALKNSRNPK
jgi:predicted dehydrogenase